MLPTNLTSNEVKDAAGSELEFGRFSQDGRSLVFAYANEGPNKPVRLSVSHQETGTGVNRVRSSVIRVDKTIDIVDDGFVPTDGSQAVVSAYCVLRTPVGKLSNESQPTAVVAMLLSFLATQGGTTVLYDGTGNGASSLINGSL